MALSIPDVACPAHVAVGTVSRVMNHQPDVHAELRDRVQRALKELNYRPNAPAQIFARNSSPVVSFLLSNRDLLHPFHSRVRQRDQEYSEASGFFVMCTRFRYFSAVCPGQLQLPSVLQGHGIVAKIKSKGRRLPEILLRTALLKRETCRPLLQAEMKTEGK